MKERARENFIIFYCTQTFTHLARTKNFLLPLRRLTPNVFLLPEVFFHSHRLTKRTKRFRHRIDVRSVPFFSLRFAWCTCLLFVRNQRWVINRQQFSLVYTKQNIEESERAGFSLFFSLFSTNKKSVEERWESHSSCLKFFFVSKVTTRTDR